MLNEKDPDAPALGEPPHQFCQLERLIFVEPCGRLVQKENGRLGGDRTRDSDEPAPAIRQLVGARVEVAGAACGSVRLRAAMRFVKYAPRSCGSDAARRLSRTEMSSNSSSDWKERAIPARERWCTDHPLIRASLNLTSPVEIGVKPVTASINVVLPAPFGPISPTICPGSTVIETSSTAVTPP
jgi:hypothetical protein